MRRAAVLLLLAVAGLSGCRRNEEPNKIIDGLPVTTSVTVLPATATQQFAVLNEDVFGEVIPVINRIGTTSPDPTFTELTGPDSGLGYSFQRTNSHYGSVNVRFQFHDINDLIFDPIAATHLSTAPASVTLMATGDSSAFHFSENLRVTLATVGDNRSDKQITGSATFSGNGYVINYTLPSDNGAIATFEGFTSGTINAVGTAPASLPTTMTFTFDANHNTNGTITWENQQGTFHVDHTGKAFIITPQSRLILN